jgi:hypothetical protein
MSTKRRHATPRDQKTLLRLLSRRRWEVRSGGNSHYQLRCPNPCKCMVVMSRSPSDYRALANTNADLDRYTCWTGAKR